VSIRSPLWENVSMTLEIVKDDGIEGAPNSAKTGLSCYAALIPPKIPAEYETMADGLKKYSSRK
jgi:hypothetical protein